MLSGVECGCPQASEKDLYQNGQWKVAIDENGRILESKEGQRRHHLAPGLEKELRRLYSLSLPVASKNCACSLAHYKTSMPPVRCVSCMERQEICLLANLIKFAHFQTIMICPSSLRYNAATLNPLYSLPKIESQMLAVLPLLYAREPCG